MAEVAAVDPQVSARRILWRLLRGAAIALAVNFVYLFVAAGRLDVPAFWAYLALQLALFLGFGLPNALRNPQMARERSEALQKVQGVHRLWHWTNRGLPGAILIVAGLDVGRFHGSDTLPLPVQVAGAGAAVLGAATVAWAMRTNAFFSSVVRLQSDRGQRVIDSGPYARVRHPGYTGMLLRYLGSTLVLGSWASFLVALAFVPLYVIRIRLEEGLLLRELEGYGEYAGRVRRRLIPGVW